MKGIFSLTLIALLAFAACKKKSSDPDPTPAGTTTTTGSTTSTTGNTTTIDINSAPQVSYSLDGTAVAYVTDGTNYFGGSGSSGNTNWTYDSGIDNGNSKTYFNITKGTITTAGGSPDDATFKTLFPVASAPYSVNAANGVEISIWDSNDVMWSTSLGSGNQSGSSFNIVQTKDEQQGYLYVKTYITFSCKVYNAAGTAKTITNGKYVGHFGNF